MKKNNRVVITGIGIISSIGNNYKNVLNSLIKRISGITFSKNFKKAGLKSNVLAHVNKISLYNVKKKKYFKFMNKASIYAYLSMNQAIKDSKLEDFHISNDKTGLIVGTGCNNFNKIKYKENKKDNNIYDLIKSMPSNISACLSEIFKIKGITYSISSACSTSTNCIANSFNIIKNGNQKIMFSGGAEELSVKIASQFDSFKLLSRNYNYNPKESSRPYDNNRNGFVISEGSGIIILEELNHALNRNANIYAEIISYGYSSYSKNIMSPSLESQFKCMKMALKNINNYKIDYLNSHATSTILGDNIELLAIKKAFKLNIPKISSTKSITGHSLGASGVHSIIFSLIMMKHNFLFPNINIFSLEKEFKNANLITSNKKYNNYKISNFMINNFGFGGSNVSLIFKKL